MAVAELTPTPTRAQRLRRSDPSGPGYARRRCGKGFMYLDEEGERLTDAEIVARITALVIPPAWRDVWISPDPFGHIQATGFDEAGRKQYLYHPRWRERRDQEKFDDMVRFARALPALREVVEHDLALGRPLARAGARVRRAAAGPRLLPDRLGGLRRDERDLRPRDDAQVARDGRRRHDPLRLHRQGVQAPRAGGDRPGGRRARRDAQAPPRRRATSCSPTSAAGAGATCARRTSTPTSRRRPGLDISAKDFRTWGATVLAEVGLAVTEPAHLGKTARKRAIVRAVKEVAFYLGNTPAVARNSYIDPRVFDRYRDGETINGKLGLIGDEPGATAIQGPIEEAVLDLLE